MGFLFVPVYVRLLGIEAYGVIGVFGAFITWLALLDAGLKPTLGREMARMTGGGAEREATWDLLRSVEFLCVGIGALIGLAALSSAHWVASSWVKADKLLPEAIAEAMAYMGAIAGLRCLPANEHGLFNHGSLSLVLGDNDGGSGKFSKLLTYRLASECIFRPGTTR